MENEHHTILKVIPGGPLEVSGDFIITDADGSERKLGSKVYLCRCGKSSNKPFCDGSHRKE